ncbi:hypothetical protein UM590_03370 [Staphylococcus aureus]|nr:hypothetical protein UM590_03370 [Staphylococcus aureus]
MRISNKWIKHFKIFLNAKQALNGDERVALAKTNGKHDIEQLNALNNAQQDGFKGRIDQSNDLKSNPTNCR